MFASAGLFLLLWAEFMAAALVLIYAGAILVTYVFVIMLAAEATPPGALKRGLEHDEISRDPMIAATVGFVVVAVAIRPSGSKPQTTGAAVSFAQVQRVIEQRCVPCHSQHPTEPLFTGEWR